MAQEQRAAGPGRPPRTVLDGFGEWLAKIPDEPAVVAADGTLTYRELDAAAGALAGELRGRGAAAEAVVGLKLHRGAGLAVAVLGILKSGAAVLPLDPDHPAERDRRALADAGASLVVAQEDVSAAMGEQGWGGAQAYHLDIGAWSDGMTGLCVPDGPGPVCTADDLMYVISTSGSTGRPKGIAMHCGPQITLLDWCRGRYASQPRALQYFPITADVAFLELLSTWWLGGRAVIASGPERLDMAALSALIERERIDKVLLPVVALDELARHALRAPDSVGSLREIITTGARLEVTPSIRELCARLPGCRLDDHYGSTEVNVVTAPRLEPPTAAWPDRPALGRPMGEARIYVLDDHLAPVPPNVPGTIHVGGVPPARGYLGRGGLTAAAFLPDPFAGRPGARMYRTGDLGRWRPDGRLEFLGRADFQLKLHGYRIEPGEIEALLRDRPDVANAVVVAVGEGREATLAAYLEPAGNTVAPPGELAAGLRELLPPHMIPQSFVVLPRLPLTGTGKIDRGRLPAPDTGAAPFAAPRDEVQQALADAFAEILDLDRVGLDDNFFLLGGHSLLTGRLAHRIRTSYGVDLPLRTLFDRPTVGALAEEIQRIRADRR